ncbi:S41 family peptidase [Hyphococcus flavus]|uniref:S41 family peptidase n=1 Tax=Hyphococcus flavus TaxID=1866326 RepID=A0AAE9ZDD7_9PROT|nr:S41 family peptidase [Hyphococcus flavus]WDI32904.1 S41 family peptidase [Hyphococcus flavus]
MRRSPVTPSLRDPKRYSGGALVGAACGGALIFGVLSSAVFARASISADTFRQLDLFGEVFEQVHENYVSAPDDADLIKGAIDGMLDTLDPHSNYLTAEDFNTVQEQTRGSYAGLGITVQMDNEGPDEGYVKVVSPFDGSPASEAGMQPGDLIVKINGEDVYGMSIDDATSRLKGKRGTKVDIAVVRDREKEPFDLTIVRDDITVPSVTARVEGDFGYVRISSFSEQTQSGLEDALKEFEKDIPGGAKGLVLDMRNNPGGLLDQSVSVADVFLNGGEIVSTRGRRPRDTMREMGRPGDKFDGKPIVVLINGGSASASEIVAGALQDRNRALLLGTKSFGKGSVQTVIPLQNGLQGALRLTTSKYYTPSGRSIQAMGIEPDIAMPVIYPGQDDVFERPSESDLPNALTSEEEPEAEEAQSADAGADASDTPLVEPFMCRFEGEGDDRVPVDCQLERALEILADATRYNQALADAGAARTE